jgi:hypothetical protein
MAWLYALNTQVQYRDTLGTWRSAPYRVVGRQANEALSLDRTLFTYTIDPWERNGEVMQDRPTAAVLEHDLHPHEETLRAGEKMEEGASC